jgi:uncharacterized coiled-coil protein SlyX
MKNKLYSILGVILLSGCNLTQFNSTANSNVYQEAKIIDYKKIKLKPSKEDKIFIREYTYNASDDDSKNSARKKAIQQIKILLSEEIGTYIESYLDIKKQNINNIGYKSIKQEIKSLSVAITKLKVLNEKWDGKTYYIKASVRVNEKQAIELILQNLKVKATQKDVKRLNKILAEQKKSLHEKNSKLQYINKKLISQEIINNAIKKKILNMKKQLEKYNKEEIRQKEEAKKYQTELERKKALILKLNQKSENRVEKEKQKWLDTKELLCSFATGTSKDDIEKIASVDIEKSDIAYESYYHQHHFVYNEYRNSEEYKFKLYNKFEYRVCPSKFLNNLGYNCIYFSFVDDKEIGIGGCYGEDL